MGFFINEITYELKQHLNLSENAWDIIYLDMRNFCGEESKQSFSGFLNKIFTNYYQDALGSIDIRAEKYKEKLLCLASANSGAVSDAGIALLTREYEMELFQKMQAYPKGIGKKFRVNRQNVEILRESGSARFYNDSVGTYMKAIFEEYASLPTAKRESVFFKDTIDLCSFAISQKNKLKISLQERKTSKGTKSCARKFYVTPHLVSTDKNGIFNYLVGISEEIKSDGSIGEKHVSSFRISRIQKISVMSSMSGFLSHQKIEEIDQEIKNKSLPYMAGDLMDVEIAFTDRGLELFERQLYLRPTFYEKLCKNTYVFHCTELQLIHYFFKFGKDAQIIQPKYLREKFKSYYKSALEAYSREDEKQE